MKHSEPEPLSDLVWRTGANVGDLDQFYHWLGSARSRLLRLRLAMKDM